MSNEILRVRLLRPGAHLPRYMTYGSAGMDLAACPKDDGVSYEIAPGQRRVIPTGVEVAVPHGYELQIRPRSGLALRYGVTVLNTPGTIDSDYRGEVMVLIMNHGSNSVTIRPGDRIAQAVLTPVVRAEVVEVETLDETVRGDGGFGHTGTKG